MSYVVTIQGSPITLPSSGESPNWSPGIIEFTQAVEAALAASVGAFDVSPQIMNIDAYNGTGADITNLSFSTSNVRAAFIKYSVFRTTNSTTAYEAGSLMTVYNPNGTIGSKWEVSRDYVGEGSIVFAISDTGVVSFTTTAISGTGHAGILSYSGAALLQS